MSGRGNLYIVFLYNTDLIRTCNVKGLILNNLNFLLSYDIYGLHWHLKGEKTSIEVIKDIVQKCIEE
ncbi:hypothetical protein CICLE_v10010132mg [Citrus x clementina]|uniref:Uncharacterized protein n=1 Tax=Citrus clementina TaxID=85681 RepID=V4UR71_CITCL|nr:hypothetical protein CICLE_v10010132mg [Citrus x clementina]